MRARDLAQPTAVVSPDTDAMSAARAMAAENSPGVVVSDDGRPYTVLPGPLLLRHLLPAYLQDDPGLARALDEEASDDLCRKLAHKSVRDLLPRAQDLDDLPVVDDDATALEVAAVMARMSSPLVAVVTDGRVSGVVTVGRLLDYLLPAESAGQ